MLDITFLLNIEKGWLSLYVSLGFYDWLAIVKIKNRNYTQMSGTTFRATSTENVTLMK